MESVSAYAVAVEGVGNGIALRNLGVATMESGVEAGDLEQVRPTRTDRPYGGKIIRLM